MKTIFTGFAPNLTSQDAGTTARFLFLPWQWFSWRKGKYVKLAEERIKAYFNIGYTYVVDSGRSALYMALKALGARSGDEILVQAYTCIVVVNAIIKTGAKPIYVDIDNHFCMSPADLEKKITTNSKVLIIQHTFGCPAQLDKLLNIAKKHNLKVIEDCAHSLGSKYNNQLTGTFGDIGMLSFGPDKIISCVRGGALITNNNELGEKIKGYQNKLPLPSFFKTKQHLLYNIFFFLNKPLYGLGIGKIILYGAKKIRAISRTVYQKEKNACQSAPEPYCLANCLAKILLNQLNELDKINEHRQDIANFYDKSLNNSLVKKPLAKLGNCVYLRYTLLVDQPQLLHQLAKKQGIILGNWYDSVIAPADINLPATGYIKDSCPQAEAWASQSINLPTNRHISLVDAERVVKVINEFK